MGLLPEDEYYDLWLVKNEGICEECGFRYLDK